MYTIENFQSNFGPIYISYAQCLYHAPWIFTPNAPDKNRQMSLKSLGPNANNHPTGWLFCIFRFTAVEEGEEFLTENYKTWTQLDA